MAYAFFLGIDVTDDEQATLSLVEKEADTNDGDASYHLRRIAQVRAEPGEEEDYAAFADRVQDLVAEQPYIGRTVLVVNRTTGPGLDVLHALDERGLSPVGVVVTGGEAAAQEGSSLSLEGGDDAAEDESSFFVAESALAGRLDRLHRSGRFEIEQPNAEEASHLAHGLQSYRARLDAADADPETSSEGEQEPQEAPEHSEAHARFVVSAGLACWLGEERTFDPTEHLGGPPPTTGEAKRLHRPDTTS